MYKDENWEEYFDGWARTYDAKVTAEYGYGSISDYIARSLSERVAYIKSPNICDIGGGTGLLGKYFNKYTSSGYTNFHICDQSEGMLKEASLIIPLENRHKINIDEDQLPWSDDFADITISVSVFQFLQGPEQALEKMVRVTKSDGLVAVSALSFVTRDLNVERPYSIGEFRALKKRHSDGMIKFEKLKDMFEQQGLEIVDIRAIKSYKQTGLNYYDCFAIGRKPNIC